MEKILIKYRYQNNWEETTKMQIYRTKSVNQFHCKTIKRVERQKQKYDTNLV